MLGSYKAAKQAEVVKLLAFLDGVQGGKHPVWIALVFPVFFLLLFAAITIRMSLQWITSLAIALFQVLVSPLIFLYAWADTALLLAWSLWNLGKRMVRR